MKHQVNNSIDSTTRAQEDLKVLHCIRVVDLKKRPKKKRKREKELCAFFVKVDLLLGLDRNFN